MIAHEQCQCIDDNTAKLTGLLNRDTVPALWKLLKAWQPQQTTLELNLSQLERVDSAGMVMLIHLLEHAKKRNCRG